MDKKALLKKLQKDRPLEDYWLKKDFINSHELIFLYYGIEPIKEEQLNFFGITSQGTTIEKIINDIDIDHIFNIIQSSNIPFIHGRGILIKNFIKFLNDKDIAIPEHFRCTPQLKKNKSKNVTKEEVLNYNVNSFSPVQCQKYIARGYAVYLWKKKYKKISANELVQKKAFKDVMNSIGAGKITDETLASWISDLGPRSKKNKN